MQPAREGGQDVVADLLLSYNLNRINRRVGNVDAAQAQRLLGRIVELEVEFHVFFFGGSRLPDRRRIGRE